MTRKSILVTILGIFLSVSNSGVIAEQKQATITAQKEIVVYVPPSRGAPKSRVGGGTRGVDPNAIIIRLLAPEDIGFSGTNQPVLYWYLSQPADIRLEITLIDDTSIEPLLEIEESAAGIQGIQALNLADYGIHLEPNVEYQWSVALVVDSEQRSKDIFATATVMHISTPAGLKTKVASAGPVDLPAIYAAGGYWYDAIESVSSLIESAPGDRQLREQRAVLAEQVALPEVALYDRESIHR